MAHVNRDCLFLLTALKPNRRHLTANTLHLIPRYSSALRLRRLLYRRPFRLLLVWLGILFAATSYVLIAAWWGSANDPWVRFEDLLIPRTMDLFVGSWFFFVGTSIGSFLNVVAWRLPLGMSVNGRSHCPRCRQELSWKDNWPVFGWLVLGGRCRTCHLPISPRYPIVELSVGLCIFSAAWVEYYTAGSILPFWPKLHGHRGALFTPPLSIEALFVMLYHAAALGCLWALALVRFDGHRLPAKLMTWTLLITLLPLLIYPTLMVVPWQMTVNAWSPADRYLDALMRALTSFVAAVFIARSLAGAIAPTADPKLNPLGEGTKSLIDLIWLVMLPAMVIGWQSAIALTTIAQVLLLLFLLLKRRPVNLLSSLAVLMPVLLSLHLCVWRPLMDSAWWPSVNKTPTLILTWSAVHLLATWLLAGSVRMLQPPALPAIEMETSAAE